VDQPNGLSGLARFIRFRLYVRYDSVHHAAGELLGVFFLAGAFRHTRRYAPVPIIRQASYSERLAMLRFSIRELLWLMLVIGIGLAWWRDHTNYQEERLLLMQSHANLQEIRQMLGDKGLGELIEMSRAYNAAPALPNTLVISMRDGSRPTTKALPRRPVISN
jgi:hypothetical protein